MRVRLTENPETEAWSSGFNTHSLGEVIIYFDEGDADSEYIRNLDVLLSNGKWMPFRTAFTLHLVIPDNYNRSFREPRSEAERERGWYDE